MIFQFLALMLLVIAPIYAMLFNIQKRLSKLEVKVKFLYEKNGGET